MNSSGFACLGFGNHTDGSVGPKGVKPSQRPQRSRHCGNWVRNTDGGSFSSPNYPHTYPPNKECLYVLEGNKQITAHTLIGPLVLVSSGENVLFKR